MRSGCQDAAPLLSPWMDGELAEVDRRWVEEHLASCAGCAARSALLAAQRDAVREHVVRAAEAADLSQLPNGVLARTEADQRGPPLSVRSTEMWRAHKTRFSVAAALAAAASVALAVGLRSPAPGPSAPGEPALMVSVDDVDFVDRPGMVLQSGQTAIIWLSPERVLQ